MVNVTVTFDPDDAADLNKARAVLDHLSAASHTETTDPEAIHQKVIALLRGYGHNRVEYIRAVAKAAPGRARYEDLVAIVGSPKSLGGTHSAIERAWRAKGMPSPFIDTDDTGDASMDMRLADIVLYALHEVDEPDPLVAARF
jgi:hypothetical protein